jgi:hypothetical protein
VDTPVTEGAVTHPIVESNIDTAQSTAVVVPTSHFPGTGNPARRLAGRQTETSRVVDRAEEDTGTVKIWQAAIDNINWVMDTVNPMTKVCPISFFLYDSLSYNCPSAGCKHSIESTLKSSRGACPCWMMWDIHTFSLPCRQTLGDQFQRDENARKLLEAIRDVFEFTNEADILSKMQPGSAQAKILNRMLQCITDCANVIESCAFMGRVGTSC